MKTKIITLYSFNELSKEAQEKAHNKWIESNDYYYLPDALNARLHELLEENKIKDLNDTSKPGTEPTQVMYSLSFSQGDGCMFEGNFEWNGYTITIKHSGNYCHSNSKIIDIMDEEGNQPETDEPYNVFETVYQDICKKLEIYGYAFIGNEDSLEHFKEMCEENDYTFLENGVMEN